MWDGYLATVRQRRELILIYGASSQSCDGAYDSFSDRLSSYFPEP